MIAAVRGAWGIAALAATACPSSSVVPDPIVPTAGATMSESSCVAALRELAAGKIAEVRLGEPCGLAEAAGAIAGLATARDATGTLGADRRQVRWRAVEAGVEGERLRLWHDGVRVVAVEVEAPRPLGGWSALRAALGAPEAKPGWWDGVVENQDGQWVYPARGLAVFTALADTEVARIVVFPPTTLAAYRAGLARGLEPPRELDGP
jgi:hypothetical protein